MLIYDAFELFIADREAYCVSRTIKYYRRNIPKFFKYLSSVLGRNPEVLECSVVTRSHVTGFVSSLRSSGYKNTTVNSYFRPVKAFLYYCIDEGFCSSDVLRRIRSLRNDSRPVIPLSKREVVMIDELFDSGTGSDLLGLCIVHLMLDAGFRCSDVISLHVGDVNFDRNYMSVIGKGNKYRIVFLCPKLKVLLLQYMSDFRPAGYNGSSPFLVVPGSSVPVDYYYIVHLFNFIRKETGITRLHPHLLRHTYATSYIMGGGNIEFLRIMLGHSDYGTTKIYLHLAQEAEMLHSDIYRLDSIFFKNGY